MNKTRLETFSDGFFAVIMTLMVLELKPPQGTSFSSLAPLDPKFISYILSFLFLGIFWNYHNLIFQATKSVSGSIVFANLAFLFCVSLIPFSLSWIGADGFSTTAVILYGTVLLFSSLSFLLILKLLLKIHGEDWDFYKAMHRKRIGFISIFLFVIGIALGAFFPKLAFFFYVIGVFVLIISARHIEKKLFK
jgi:uncharacterized membrane protein